MPLKPLFEGLIVDELGQPVSTATIGEEPCYVVLDGDFRRHIPSQQVDRQVLEIMRKQISGNEDLLSEQAAKLLGTEDIFSKAMLNNQLKNIDQQFDALFQTGIPEEARSFMGMSGFKVVIDYNGNVVKLEQPAGPEDNGDNE
jgi:hypothetical protein